MEGPPSSTSNVGGGRVCASPTASPPTLVLVLVSPPLLPSSPLSPRCGGGGGRVDCHVTEASFDASMPCSSPPPAATQVGATACHSPVSLSWTRKGSSGGRSRRRTRSVRRRRGAEEREGGGEGGKAGGGTSGAGWVAAQSAGETIRATHSATAAARVRATEVDIAIRPVALGRVLVTNGSHNGAEGLS